MNQTYNQSKQSIQLVNKSGIDYIDALFNNRYGQPIRWLSDPTLKNKEGITKITYSFPGLNGNNLLFNYEDDRGKISASSFTSEQAEDIRKIFINISKYFNIEFIEIQEIEENVGTIRLALNTITDEAGVHRPGIVATADPPSVEARGGDIWFNINYNTSNFSEGLVSGSMTGVGDITVMYHEIFHSLGLEHPEDNPSFPEDRNSREFTVMAAEFVSEGGAAYFSSDNYVVASTPMILDIVSLQYLYGANIFYNSDDTTYSYDPNIPFIETIWDGGGTDTLDFSKFNKSNTLNLADGQSSTIGFDINWSMKNNLGIAYNAIIENAKGGSGSDTINGNKYKNNIQGNAGNDIIYGRAGNDLIIGGEGNDVIDGGTGKDTASYSGNLLDYSINTATNIYQIKDNRTGSNDGTDTLRNIEYIKFSDQTISISNNQIPTGITLSATVFNENIDAAAAVAALSTTDDDKSDTHTYSLVSGNGDTDNDAFIIDSSLLKIKVSPDFETKSSYNIRLKTTDAGSESFEQAFTLSVNDSQELDVSHHVVGDNYKLEYISDYGGNLHANTGSVSEELKSSYKYQGKLDVNKDGIKEAIYTNKESGRWVTASVDSITGEIDYSKYGQGGTTRIVGIYIDPLVASGDVVQGSDHDSQRRFQNDLKNDNLIVKTSGDYDGDGSQEVYWKTVDGTAYLRALMHADGNIQYANYQSLDQMTNYLTGHGFADTVTLIA